MTSDAVNAIFEGVGACMILLNIRQLHRDKAVAGFHPGPLSFFTGWGIWNCWFYPANGLPLSFVAGAVLASANLVYVGQVVYYLKIHPALKLVSFIENKDKTPWRADQD